MFSTYWLFIEKYNIYIILQWMERSKGKKMMSQSRTSMIVEPFRSTVQRSPTKEKMMRKWQGRSSDDV